MIEAGKMLAAVIKEVTNVATIGINLLELNQLTERLIKQFGALPAFLNYKPHGAKKPYPASICASLNDVVVHGVPTDYMLKSGDVLKLDFGLLYKGFYVDSAVTLLIGKTSNLAKNLTQATALALEQAIKKCVAGNTLGDIGFEIESIAKQAGFKVIKELTGHGIGRKLHEAPNVYNYGQKGQGMLLRPGLTIAIEPMFAVGTNKIIQKEDDSWATADGSLSAHFEHTVAITDNGPLILTL